MTIKPESLGFRLFFCLAGKPAFDGLYPTFGERKTRCWLILNFVYKTRVLAFENAVFLNSKSAGRKYAILAKSHNELRTKHLRFPDVLLVSQKGLVTLPREPYDAPTRLSSLAH